MRLVRIGDAPSRIGADVAAALTSWSRGDAVVGGIALVGPQPPGCPHPVDAVVVLPRGVLVIAGVDLPDPAMRLDAPLSGPWKTDGWPLVRPGDGDGAAANPAAEAMASSTAIAALLQSNRAEPVPVSTVVAVGPYVEQVSQPTADLMRGVRILHPEPMTLLTATRELAVQERPCTVRQAQVIIAALAPDATAPTDAELAAEGFPNTASDMASASTTLIPRFRDREQPKQRPAKAKQSGVRWLPAAAVGLIGVLVLAGIIVAVASAGKDKPPAAPTTHATTPASAPAAVETSTQPAANVMPGLKDSDFVAKGVVQDADCAADLTGDMQVWLEQHGCDRLLRARYLVTVNGKQAAVLLAVLAFPDEGSATAFKGVADLPGSGAIVDPAAQGKPWPGGVKPSFESAGYASKSEGASVLLAQTTWAQSSPKPGDEALTALAQRATQLPPPQ